MKRKKRKTVGHRSAIDGKFVAAEEAESSPETTVAVTKVVEDGGEETESDNESSGESEA